MSAVTVEWTIRANGRKEGDRETVEKTPYIDALVAAGRLKVIEEFTEDVSTSHPLGAPKLVATRPVAPLDAPLPESVPPVGEPGAEGLTVKPGPRRPNRAPIRVTPVKE